MHFPPFVHRWVTKKNQHGKLQHVYRVLKVQRNPEFETSRIQLANGSSLTESWISASAAGDRGLIIHLNGTGYDSNPLVNSGLSLMVLPWSSAAGLMSYTARRQDAIEYNELSLRCLPGHIRRPYPNAAQSGFLTSGLGFPSFRYRSGWNSMGLL